MAKQTSAELDLLASVDLFQGLTRKELQAIHSMSREQTFGAGAVVAEEGAAAGRFYLILDGKASVTVDTVERPLATLGPGDYFGEISLIDGEPRTATVTADTPLRTLTLASFNFKAILHEYPATTRKILLEMCRRVRRLDQSLQH
jgi:CRP-like cAMP-binding protein